MFNIHFGLEGYLPWMLYFAMWATFAASVFWRPSVGVYLLAFSLPLQTGRYRIHDMPLGTHFLDILVLGTLLGLWFKEQEIVPKSPINKLLVVLAIFYYFSLFQGSFFIDIPLPLWIDDPRFSDWKNYVEMFLFAPLVAATLKEKRQIQCLLLLMSLSMLAVNRAFYSTMSGRDLTRFSYDIRYEGPLGYAGVNGLAALEAMFISFLMGMYSYAKTFKLKVGLLLLLATSTYVLLFSFSRGGYISMMATLLLLGLLKNRKLLIFLMILLISWETLLPTAVQERILMTTDAAEDGAIVDSSAQDRLVMWQDALNLIMQNPATGTGFYTYKYMGRVGGYRDTHNYYIKILVETGIVGFVLFITLICRLVMTGFRLFQSSDDPFWAGVGLGFLAMICSAVVLNIFGDRWTYQQVNGFLWILLGCVIRGQLAVDTKEQATALSSAAEANKIAQPVLMAPSGSYFASCSRRNKNRYGLVK